MSAAHKTDFYGWTRSVSQQLRAGTVPQADVDALAEEIESLGVSVYRELRNRLAVLLTHLLKWEHQPSLRGRSWELTIRDQRRQTNRLLAKNPSLKVELEEAITDAYESAVVQAMIEIGLPEESFPASCPYSLSEILNG